MRATKRLAASDFNPFTNDSIENKRILAGSPFDSQRAEPSQLHTVAPSPQLDTQRAETSRQHVRALNTQFASWIQTQLEKHPDELWEDGVQDYLSHARAIMEKFSDVVSWLKANAAKVENTSLSGSDTSLKKFGTDSKEKDNGFSFGKPVVPLANTIASFATPWNSGVLTNNSAPFYFGIQSPIAGNQNQNSTPLNDGAANDLEGEDDAEQPGSPSVKKSEEKGIIVVHEVRCKLYMKSNDPKDEDPWKHKGTGQLSIKCKEDVDKGTKESKPTIVVRNDVGKVLLNASLYPGIKTSMQKNSLLAIFHTTGDGDDNETVTARTFMMRTRSEEERNKLAELIKEYAPEA